MKCTKWAICGAGWLLLAVAGCGNNGRNGPEDMLHPLPDGFLSGCSADDDCNNDPNGGFGEATNQTANYTCATNETGGEISYPFTSTVAGPVTVTLHVTNTSGGADGGADGGAGDMGAGPDMAQNPDPDLDL